MTERDSSPQAGDLVVHFGSKSLCASRGMWYNKP